MQPPMKKSQRLRLTALAAKDAATLTTAEQSELAGLQSLAGQHADASKDIDDTTPAAAPAAAAPAVVVVASTTPATAPPAAAPGIRAMVASALAVVRGGAQPVAALAGAQQTVATLQQQLATVNNDLTATRATLLAVQTHLNAFAAYCGITAADLAGKDAAAATELINARLQAVVTEQLGTLGFNAASLPAAPAGGDHGSGSDIDDLRGQINAEKDPQKKGKLVAKLNALKNKTKK